MHKDLYYTIVLICIIYSNIYAYHDIYIIYIYTYAMIYHTIFIICRYCL